MTSNAPDVTFVTTRSGNPSVFERNFAASPCLAGLPPNRIIVQEGFSSAAFAYNEAIEKAQTDLIVFCHQDVYFPETWLGDLNRSLEILKKSDPDWSVLGCSGIDSAGMLAGFLYSVGLGVLGSAFVEPVPVNTLDEFILILRKSSGLRFDPNLPRFHFYGTDICLSARSAGKQCYAISAFTVHNTSYGPLSADFYKCYWDIKKKWSDRLPIQTPCIKITKWNQDFIMRRLKHVCFWILGRNVEMLPRLEDPRSIFSSPDTVPKMSNENSRTGVLSVRTEE